jgi:hypothetical protein
MQPALVPQVREVRAERAETLSRQLEAVRVGDVEERDTSKARVGRPLVRSPRIRRR